jgi:hypothetical protein
VTDIDVAQLEQNPQARWAIVEVPQAAPGECLLCRGEASNRQWFVDTGISWDYYGAIYICNECVLEITHILGFITPQEAVELKTDRDVLAGEVHHLSVQLASLHSLENAVDDFLESRNRLAGLRVGSSVPISSEPATDSSVESIDGGAEGGSPPTEGSVGSGAGTTPESDDDEGMAELHSDAGPDGSEFTLNI